MVFFTCNACGEALKKNAVEKHSLRCKINEGLSCMDCNKSFGKDYVDHLSCITENQKYGGSDFVQKAGKGQQKQGKWLADVHDCIKNTTNISPKVKELLQVVMAYQNIPRKEKGFMNFLNCIKGRHGFNMNVRKDAWKILNGVLSAEKSNTASASPTDTAQTESQAEDCIENGNKKVDKKSKEDERENDKSSSKKSKKNKRKKNHVDDVESEDLPKKKKKAKLDKVNNKENEICEESEKKKFKNDGNEDKNETLSAGISKKKKKKRDSSLIDHSENPSNNEFQNNNNNSEVTNGHATPETSSKPKKKKDKKSASQKETEHASNTISIPNGHSVNIDINTSKSPSEFKWKSSLKAAIRKSAENRIKVKKLKKLVVAQYLQSLGLEGEEHELNAIKTFENKINNGNFVIEDKYIMLK